MKNIILFVIFIMALVIVQFAQGRSVDDIIRRYIYAIGGKEKLNAISSVYMEGSREIMGQYVDVKIITVQDKLYRINLYFNGGSSFFIATPTAGWAYVSIRSQQPQLMEADQLKTLLEKSDIEGPLINYFKKGHKAEVLAKEEINGVKTHVIKLTKGSGKEIIYYLDADTDLLLQTKQFASKNDDENNEEIITTYNDYKPVNGILFAHTITVTGSGLGSGKTMFSKIELNKIIPESEYTPYL